MNEAGLTQGDPDEPAVAPPRDWFPALAVAFLAVALVCGGSSTSAVSAGIVRVCAVPVLALSVWRMARRPTASGAAWPIVILTAAAAVIIAQLIPLPPALWSRLPGHQLAANVYTAAELPAPWLPISLMPDATWSALLGLFPPAAMLAATLTLGTGERRILAAAVVVLVMISVGLGMLQLATGVDSPLRPYSITNPTSAVGYFANRNHQATLLATSLPLVAYLATRWAGPGGARASFWVAAAVGYALIVAAGVAGTGARAGFLLLVLGGAGSLAVVLRARVKSPKPAWRFAAFAAPAVFTLLAAGLCGLALDPSLQQAVQARSGPELRFSLNPQAARAGLEFAPLGSGAGSFAQVYQAYEPISEMGPAFVNHAHDDFVEVWLEAGVSGVALVFAFLAWWAAATWSALKHRHGRGAALSLAGSLIVGMFLIHSLVDYPLRTPALATLFAFACGLIVPAAKAEVEAEAGRARVI